LRGSLSDHFITEQHIGLAIPKAYNTLTSRRSTHVHKQAPLALNVSKWCNGKGRREVEQVHCSRFVFRECAGALVFGCYVDPRG
jgi:hypothetical protein